MEPRKDVKVQSTQTEKGYEVKRKGLQIVKLEERIAPKLAANHNETLVCDVG